MEKNRYFINVPKKSTVMMKSDLIPYGKFKGVKMVGEVSAQHLLDIRAELNGKKGLVDMERAMWDYINDNFDSIVIQKHREKNKEYDKIRV